MDFRDLSMLVQDVSLEGKLYMAVILQRLQSAQKWYAVAVVHVLGLARSYKCTLSMMEMKTMQT